MKTNNGTAGHKTSKEHYDQHLGPIYSWMVGDAGLAMESARVELTAAGIANNLKRDGIAIDLGAGPGTYAIPLADMGYAVTAIDACAHLLDELKSAAGPRDICIVPGDITSFREHCPAPADVILCTGDTLTHLPSVGVVENLLKDVNAALAPGGLFIATFRDYSQAREVAARFIPVRSDASRIHTCFLEFAAETVLVHDIVHERGSAGWEMKVSAYPKLRLDPAKVKDILTKLGMEVKMEVGRREMVRLVGRVGVHLSK